MFLLSSLQLSLTNRKDVTDLWSSMIESSIPLGSICVINYTRTLSKKHCVGLDLRFSPGPSQKSDQLKLKNVTSAWVFTRNAYFCSHLLTFLCLQNNWMTWRSIRHHSWTQIRLTGLLNLLKCWILNCIFSSLFQSGFSFFTSTSLLIQSHTLKATADWWQTLLV